MTTLNTVVRARIDQKTKEEAEAVLAVIGLNLSDAVRLMMIRIAREGALPFEPLIPNKETIQAIKDARAGKTKSFDTVGELFADLNAQNSQDEEV
jgi:DNA-damage-inducible protein J